MHYYQHHINDFSGGTKNFSRLERWIYRDMIEHYYDKETALPGDFDQLCDDLGIKDNEEMAAVSRILRRKFQLTETGYRHERCDLDIAAYHAAADTARINGKKGGRPPKNNPAVTEQEPKITQPVISGLANKTQQEPSGNPDETGLKANHKPITNNHKPEEKQTSEQSPDMPSSKPKKEADEQDLAAARWIFETILANNPEAKPPNLEAWADDIRRMREIDHRRRQDMCELFLWASQDSFWFKNILSPATLRKQWDKLVMARKAPPARNGAKPDNFLLDKVDHSSSAAAMQSTLDRLGLEVPAEGEKVEF